MIRFIALQGIRSHTNREHLQCVIFPNVVNMLDQKRSWMVWYTHITVQDCGPLVSKCLSSREFSDSPRKFGCRLFICGLSSTLLPYKNNSFHIKYGN